ncbi:MAG TPA: protein DpdJ [Bacillus sp. (in: firmicutes)]|nr:protein DpdJ [Bacillus sp. (in: firmicutes)]
MKRDVIDIVAEEMLTQIEKKENQLLEWGMIGGNVDAEQEIIRMLRQPPTRLLEDLIKQNELGEKEASILLQNLIDRKLLLPLNDGFRSRYAETVRLLYLLKQRFKFKDWQEAPNLVSNIKPFVEYREYPKRDQDFSQVMNQLKHISGDANFRKDILYTLLENGNIQLARFQVDSLQRLLGYRSKVDVGVVVGAGTGSGKTKAFYLPAFVKVLDAIRNRQTPWTKVLGIYPRVELLKDQYKEAIKEILKLNHYALKKGIRPITIGSYYRETPDHAQDVVDHKDRSWKKIEKGYICPFFSCPTCGGTMVWTEEDVQREIKEGSGKYERLVCIEAACQSVIHSENVILTRKRMKQAPPDILFTTTEMLNRKITNTKEWPVFGINAFQPPLFLLLDEIHIYDGITGANVAYLLRRWRHLVKLTQKVSRGIQFVGLSATLSNPLPFFSQLTGLPQDSIHYISPKPEDMVVEGAEYNLIVRGDPFSSTSLLSTTVQTAMLMGRMLDPLHRNVSRDAFGSKIFGFTDKLDLVNRWYHIELDAEKRNVLSQFRDHSQLPNDLLPTATEQHVAGQIWEFARQIDANSLIHPLEVDIASSQYKGVNEQAKLVIATSALEVGYNDSKVGAVLQHKSPRNMASFLQRKGRAGRKRGMRPWTIVITSAFGRDRFVYDYPEYLFNPTLNHLYLPLKNQYVQRIQAAFALMDWLTWKLSSLDEQQDIRILLTKRGHIGHQRYIQDLLLQILRGDDLEFKDYLSQALQLPAEQLEQILWLPPRSLYMELFPTLINLLQTQFEKANEEEQNTPLSGYVPKALFESLYMTDLEIQVPGGKKEHLPIVQAMTEFAPGNVSKRYVNAYKTYEAHWLPILSPKGVDLDGKNVRSRVLEEVEDEDTNLIVCEPYLFSLEQIPKHIKDQSYAIMDWRVKLNPFSASEQNHISLPRQSNLYGLLKGISYFTSDENNYVQVVRYAPVSHATVKYKRRNTETKVIPFHYKGKSAAIGFERFVDAICFSLHSIEPQKLFALPEWNEIEKSVKPEYYLYITQQDPKIIGRLNVFEIQWLSQIILSSVIAIAVSKKVTLCEAIDEFKKNYIRIAHRTLEVIFHSTVVKAKGSEESRDREQDENRVYKELLGFIQDESLMEVLIKHLSIFTIDLRKQEQFIYWMKETLIATVGASIQKAIEGLLPGVNTSDLVLDICGTDIWLSESESGGIGIVTKVVSMLKNKVAQFEELFIESLERCVRHHVTASLRAMLPHITTDHFAGLLENIRRETKIEQQRELLMDLQHKLDQVGIVPEHELIISFATHFLRGKGNRELDLLRQELHQLWHEEEKRLQCKIDSHVFAVACFNREGKEDKIATKIELLFQKSFPGHDVPERQRFLLVESLLFADCVDSCPECLVLYSPFQRFVKPSRILLRHFLPQPYKIVKFREEDWKKQVRESLYHGQTVRLVTDAAQREEIQKELFEIINEPIEYAYELYYPYIDKVRQDGLLWQFDLRIREVSYE